MTTDGRPVAYLLVENGLHAGARLELREAGQWYSAGGLVDAEYWLADPDLAEAKAEFALVDGAVCARLVTGPPLILGTTSLEPGAAAVALDQPLLWGGVSFRGVAMPPLAAETAAPAAAPAPVRRPLAGRALDAVRRIGANRRLLSVALALLALVVPAAVVLSLLGSMLERRQAMELQRDALSAQEDPRAQYLRARSAAQRLSDLIGVQSVSVTALDGKTLAVFGTNVARSERERVRAAVAQFERDFAVRDNVVYQAEAMARAAVLPHLPEGIDLVQYGPQGYLRGHDGRLYLPGGVLPNGMQVDLIREREVWLSRGSERAVLRAGETID
jgi:hypothetical protein